MDEISKFLDVESGGEEADWGELIPELQRFYHGNPESWLHVPIALLKAYIAMLPRLKKQEMFELYEVLTLAAPAPTSKKEQQQRKKIHDSLQKVARQQQRQSVYREPQNREQTLVNLSQMGFEVIR